MCFWTPESFLFAIENLLLQIQIAKRLFKVIAGENCARQVRLLRFLLMQNFENNQQKINILQLWKHLKTLKFLINFCTILKVLLQSNFLLLLCSKRKTKIVFTPPYCTSLSSLAKILVWFSSSLSEDNWEWSESESSGSYSEQETIISDSAVSSSVARGEGGGSSSPPLACVVCKIAPFWWFWGRYLVKNWK